ncbi:ATP-binding cassette domain-containing protein, partial [bacterium]|nr:ATP-binding cassette domain-containing protein [bacterium]
MLAVTGVSVAFERERVLDAVDMHVEPGTIHTLIGPNGAGKTTLIRAILGLHPADRGSITVFGQPVSQGNPAIGYLPQVRSTAPQMRLAGRDFLAAGISGDRFGLPLLSRQAAHDIDRVLEIVHAEALARRPLSEMSGGERQRLLIAQALLGNPRMILLDEPLIGLDPHQQNRVVSLVRDLSRQMKLTVLFSAHELNQLLGSIDRVLYLGHRHAALGTVD